MEFYPLILRLLGLIMLKAFSRITLAPVSPSPECLRCAGRNPSF